MLFEKYTQQGAPMFVREVNESIKVSQDENLENFFKKVFEKFKNKEVVKISRKDLKYLYLPFYLDDIVENIVSVQKMAEKNKKLEKLKRKIGKISDNISTKYKKMFTLIQKLNQAMSNSDKQSGKIVSYFEELAFLAREYQKDIDNLKPLKEEKYQDKISLNQPNDYVDREYFAEDDDEEEEEKEKEEYGYKNNHDEELSWADYGIIAATGVALVGVGAACYAFLGGSNCSKDMLS